MSRKAETDTKKRRETGSIVEKNGRLYARIKYTKPDGKSAAVWRAATNRTHAKQLINDLKRELEERGSDSISTAQKNFAELADYYEKTFAQPPVYVDGRKVSGLRSARTVNLQLTVLREHFGKSRLRSVTFGDLLAFRDARLATPTNRVVNADGAPCGQRAVASVNREMALLRRILNVAHDEGWILANPFKKGLISVASETQRQRILTREEEQKLLSACDTLLRCSHLKPILIAALDTGCRQGELLKLRWADVDLANRLVTIRAFNTKTERERHVSLTVRLTEELARLWEASEKKADGLVFGVRDNVKHSFESVRKEAGLPDVRFHDLRHTAASRLVGLHLPLAEVGRVLGHTQANTTYRYVNANLETARRASEALDTFHANGPEAQPSSNVTELVQ